MASVFNDEQWKYSLNLCVCVATTFEVVSGGCSSNEDNNTKRKGDSGNECWYELWYFWFIVALVLIILMVLVVFYCKQQVKRSVGRRGRRRTPVLTMPSGPPCYEDPGHQPPPYHIAMSTRQCEPVSTQQTQLPGCIVDVHTAPDCNTMFPSMLSIGAFSNPPPYSPPRSACNRTRPS